MLVIARLCPFDLLLCRRCWTFCFLFVTDWCSCFCHLLCLCSVRCSCNSEWSHDSLLKACKIALWDLLLRQFWPAPSIYLFVPARRFSLHQRSCRLVPLSKLLLLQVFCDSRQFASFDGCVTRLLLTFALDLVEMRVVVRP